MNWDWDKATENTVVVWIFFFAALALALCCATCIFLGKVLIG